MFIMKTIGLMFLCTLALLSLPLQAQTVLDLSIDEYIEKVRENHPKIKIEEIGPEIKKSIYEEHPVVSGFGGVLTAGYQQNFNDTSLKNESKSFNFGWAYKLLKSGTSFGINFNNVQSPVSTSVSTAGTDLWNTTATLSLEQPLLFNGLLGDSVNTHDIKRYEYEISQVSSELTMSQIILQALLLYRRYEITKEINNLSKELLKSAREIFDFNRKRVKIGTVSRSDILNSESQIIKNQIDIQNSDNNLIQLQESILYNMGYGEESSKNIKLKFSDNPNISKFQKVNFQEVWDVASRERKEFQLYSLQLAAAENAISLGKKAVFPQLNAFLNYSFLGQDSSLGESYNDAFNGFSFDNTDLTIGVNLIVSTDLSKYRLASQRPNQNKELAERSLIDFQNNLRNDLRVKVRNFNNAYDVYKKNQKVEALTSERYSISRKEYFIGKLDYPRLLQVEQELKQATINYLNSKIAYYLAELELENSQGIVLKKYGIE